MAEWRQREQKSFCWVLAVVLRVWSDNEDKDVVVVVVVVVVDDEGGCDWDGSWERLVEGTDEKSWTNSSTVAGCCCI